MAAVELSTSPAGLFYGSLVLKQPLKVLIIDDSEDAALLLVRHLQASGYRPMHERVDKKDALAPFLEKRRWDVVLCDHATPGLSSVEALRTVRRYDPHVPLVVVAGAAGEGEVVQLVKLGVQDVVLKDNLARLKPVIARELAEAQMRRGKAEADVRLVGAIESIAEGMALYDADDRLILCNRRYREILDRCAAHITPGALFEDILRHAVLHGQLEDTGPEPEAFIQTRLARHRDPGAPFEQKLSDGRWTRVEERRTADGGIISVLTDITDRKKLDRMKSEFVSVVGHELRTPLTSIKGSLALLESRATGELSPKAAAMIGIAHRNSDRLVRLVNDILDLQKIEAGKMQFGFDTVGVRPLLEQAVAANRTYANEHGADIKLRGSAGGMRVLADSERLMQVLSNLLSNAAKFSPAGGTITIAARRMGDSVRISVADQGPGIPEDFRDHIFQKFVQADSSDTRKLGGTGLGLSIAKAIVESHGGTIGFDSAEGRGTTFFFDLPVWRPEEAKRATSQDMPRPKLLVCDDDAKVRARLKELIGELGCDVETCATAAEARQLLRDGGFTAMTLDVAFPNRDGIKLIREVRQHPQTQELPIIVVSAKARGPRPGLNVGAVKILDWLEMPIDRQRLKRSIGRVIEKTARRRPRILHIEDDDDHRYIVSQAVGDLADIETATKRKDAQRRLRNPDYDLVIMDLLLPDGSGESLLPLIHAHGRSAPPVLIFSVKEVPQSVLENTAGALIKSRASNNTLKEQIEQLLSTAMVTQDVPLLANAGG